MAMVTTLRKLDTNVTPVTVVSALAVLLKQLTLEALKAPHDGVTSIAQMATMASMASMVPMAMMALASLASMASMVWVTDLNRRKLRYEMLKFSPWKTWICSSKNQALDAEGSRSSRRVDVAKVKKELMGSQIWSVVLTWAMMVSMVASMASVASTEMRVSSVALGASRILVIVLIRRKLSDEWLRLSPLESWLGSSKQTWVMTDPEARDGLMSVKMKKELMGSLIWSVVTMWARMASMASMVSMAPGARMEIASAALKDVKAVAPVLRWYKLGNKLLVLQQSSYENSSKIWLGSTLLMAVEDDGPDDAKVKIELMTCQLGALDDGDERWRQWMASMAGFDGWRRWWIRRVPSMVASMVDVDGGLGSSTQRALTWKSLCVPSGEGGTHSVACSLSEQFAGCPVAFVPVSRL